MTKEEAAKYKVFVDRLRNDPEFFFRVCWGDDIYIWEKLQEVVHSVRDNRYTVVRAGHGVGKSWLIARLAIWFLSTHRPAKVITTAPTWTQVEQILWSEINTAYKTSRIPLGGKLLDTKWEIDKDTFAIGISTTESVGQRDFGATKLQGFHSPNMLFLLDEGAGVPQEIWTAAKSIVTGQNNKIVAIGNPSTPSGAFFDCFQSELWNKIHISSLDHPNVTGKGKYIQGCVTKEWIDERRIEWGEGTPIYEAKVCGNFPVEGIDSLFSLLTIQKSYILPIKSAYEIVLGVDVARFGDDETVVYSISGNKIVLELKAKKLAVTETVGQIVQLMLKYMDEPGNRSRVVKVAVDDSGVGGGVTDLLRQECAANEKLHNVSVIAINFGEKASDSEKYFNKKAEIYYTLRQALIDGLVRLPMDEVLKNQLISTRYSVTSRGQVKIESKDEMKKRGLKSPDRADALVIAYAARVRVTIDSGHYEQTPSSKDKDGAPIRGEYEYRSSRPLTIGLRGKQF